MRAHLVGDGVENPANARALLDTAAMFEVPCLFRDTRGLADRWSVERGGQPLPTVGPGGVPAPVVAVENAPGAGSVFTTRLPAGRPSIVVGNERRGIRADLMAASTLSVQIPAAGRGIDTLNVAAAAAVALYYLLGATGRRSPRSARPEAHRPAVVLVGPRDHVEAGSALRTAAAFGWQTVGLDDRDKVWFGTPRTMRAEGRAAARSHRNPLRVVPVPDDVHSGRHSGYERVVVAGTNVPGPPLHRVDLTGGPRTALVIPDGTVPEGAGVEYARVDVPGGNDRYRLVASIVLAEAARQLGIRPATRPRRFAYESTLTLVPPEADLVHPDELLAY